MKFFDKSQKAENSLSLRILWGLLASCSFVLIALAPGQTATLTIGTVQLPLLVMNIWIALSGASFSYYFRERKQIGLEILGIISVITFCLWFYNNLQNQISGGHLELLSPTLYLVAGLFASHSFELRTRFDFNFSLALNLVLLFLACSQGHGWLFGLTAMICLLFVAIILILNCQNQFAVDTKNSETAGNIFKPLLLLLAFMLCFFAANPRAESIADELTAQLCYFLKYGDEIKQAKQAASSKTRAFKKVRRTYREAKPGERAENAELKEEASHLLIKQKQAPPNKQVTAQTAKAKALPAPPPSASEAKQSSLTNKNEDTFAVDQASPQSTDVLFDSECNRTVYFKRAYFDTFDGQRWSVKAAQPTILKKEYSDYFPVENQKLLSLPQKVPSIGLVQKYTIKSYSGNSLIFAGFPNEIEFPAQRLFLEQSGTIKTILKLSAHISYTVHSQLPIYNFEALREINRLSAKEEAALQKNMENFLQIPEAQEEKTYRLSEKIRAESGNWFAQSEGIAQYLRRHYQYKTRIESGKRSAEKNCVDSFLFKEKCGDCKDFASAFVLLCRSIGIPSRLAVGYGPGTFNTLSGQRQIREKDAHAWGEIFIPQVGWIPFDAAPGGILPGKPVEQEHYVTALRKEMEKTFSTKKQEPSPNLRLNLDPLQTIFAVAAFILFSAPLLVACRSLIAAYQKQRRMHPASRIYERTAKRLKRFGLSFDESQTPEELIAELAQQLTKGNTPLFNQLHDCAKMFINEYNSIVFGRKTSLKQLTELSAEINALSAQIKE
ncbi:MAG: transglutaminase-like domain-containing protein [Candidatus Obscuribacterales bacterium]|nr:transglutaminase-like domain-containing protein [Candidatus Obscuribacterales bacterium]